MTPETMMGTRKFSGGSEIVTFVRNHMTTGLKLNLDFGTLERMDDKPA